MVPSIPNWTQRVASVVPGRQGDDRIGKPGASEAEGARIRRRSGAFLRSGSARLSASRFAILSVFVAVSVSFVGCSALSKSELVSLGVEYWDAQPGGAVQSDFGSIGDRIDVDSILDLGGERVWVYHAAASVGPTRVEASYLDLGFSGVSNLLSDVDFGGVTFPGGDNISSDLDTSAIQIHSQTGFFNWNFLKFGIVAGLDNLVIDSQITSLDTPGIAASRDYDEWLPVVGLSAGASVPLMKVEVFADGEVSGLLESISFGQLDGDYISSVVRGGVNIDQGFKVGIGYRSLLADFQDGPDTFDIDLGGGFLFLELDF